MENKEIAKNEHWDLEIRPQVNLFDLNLKDIWRYRDLLVLFVKRDFVAQYKQTILGPLWHLIQPLLTTLMFLFIFGRVARMKTDGIEPTVTSTMLSVFILLQFLSETTVSLTI